LFVGERISMAVTNSRYATSRISIVTCGTLPGITVAICKGREQPLLEGPTSLRCSSLSHTDIRVQIADGHGNIFRHVGDKTTCRAHNIFWPDLRSQLRAIPRSASHAHCSIPSLRGRDHPRKAKASCPTLVNHPPHAWPLRWGSLSPLAATIVLRRAVAWSSTWEIGALYVPVQLR
jgi:hypothetical protein